MIRSGWSRLGRQLVGAVVLLLGVGTVPCATASAAVDRRPAKASLTATHLSGFVTTRTAVRVGGQLWSTVTVSPRSIRTITVQYRRAGTTAFKTASRANTSTLGVLTIGLKPIGTGTWQFRAVVSATSRATGVASALRTVVASGRATATKVSGFVTSAATVSLGLSLTDDVVVTPGGARFVSVEARRPGSAVFTMVSSGTSSTRGAFRAVYRPTVLGVWRYRLVARATATALPATSPIRTVTAVDRTPPGPVTQLRATATTTSVSLTWTNPTVADFAGVTIRRASGPIAPASPAAGAAVGAPAKPATTLTDHGLTVDTQYSYAVFARDGVPNYSAAAKLTVSTSADTTAPGPVADVHTTEVTAPSITLAWINPADADFAGVTIRRALGSTPATPTAGTPVADLDSAATTFTDAGLTGGIEYFYAVFAHDGTSNYAAAAPLGVVTPQALTAPPDAELIIVSETNKLTVGTPVSFDATGSVAVEGELVSATLDYGDDSPLDTFAPTDFPVHTYASTGTKTVTLTVTDSNGAAGTTTATVPVFPAPTASVEITGGTAYTGRPVTFGLSVSTPVGTTLTSYALDVTGPDTLTRSDTTAPPLTEDVVFTKAGTYAVQFNVTNDAGASVDAKPLTLEVLVDPTPPTAVLTVDGSSGPTMVTLGADSMFDATASAPAAGHTLESATLDFGDGSAVVHRGADPATWLVEHTYASAGAKTATLTVTDTYGITATAAVSVTVFVAPTVRIVPSGEALTGQSLRFKATSSTPVGTRFTEYKVSYDNGLTQESDDGPPPATLTHTFGAAGDYTVILEVFNNADGHAKSTVVVTIADVDVTAPGPVTGLRTTGVTPSSVPLAWTNPTDTDFAGVTIRRANGATPPASVTDGVAIAELDSAESTFTDTTVISGAKYSYAVFAHDGIPNAAAAAALTVTAHNPPTAALAVTPKLTVNGSTSFDASGSSAAGGFTLASADLDFGDGSAVFHFAGDPATWQVNHAYPKAGADVATLTVTDSDRLTATTTVPVTVFAAPTASIAPNRPPQVGIPTTFQATVSTPIGTSFTEYKISYDGGTTYESFEGSAMPTLTHTFVKEGIVTVKFEASNDAGGTVDASIQITVSGLTE